MFTQLTHVTNDKIDKEAEAAAMLVENTRKDISEILRLTNIKKPDGITLFIAENWKYDFIRRLKDEMKKTRNAGEIIKALMSGDLKNYGQEISKMVPKLINDTAKVPSVILDQDIEFHALDDFAYELKEEFKCDVEVIVAENTKEQKAKQASPSKAAILVE